MLKKLRLGFNTCVNTNIDTVLKTHSIRFLSVALWLKPQKVSSCTAISKTQTKPPL